MINTKKPNFMRATTQMLNMVAGLPPYYILHKKTQTRNCCRIGYISSEKNITEQDQIKIQGEVASNIINKIANANVNIKQKSLRESIINDIVKANQIHPYSRLATTLLPIFRGGVYLPRSIYSQQRVEIGSNQNKTMFCPTVLVTQQIFQRCLNSWKKSSTPEIFYGLFGASKTFSFILYGLLSSFVSKAAYKNLIAQSLFVPKLVYFTVDPKILAKKLIFLKDQDLLTQSKIYQKLGFQQVLQSVYYQCPELYKELPREQHQDKMIKDTDIKKYEQKGIKTIFLVDQINTVASYVRRKMNGQIKPGLDQKSYQLCMKMNEARKAYTGSFSKIILNSSYNFQFYDRKIIQEVGVNEQEKHSYLNQRNFGKLSYLERFSNNKEQTLLSLTDLIIFNIEDLITQVPQTIDGINVRNIVYKIIMENQDQMFTTPLGIRNVILKIEQDATLKQNLVKSMQNIKQFTQGITKLVADVIQQTKSFYKKKIVDFVEKQSQHMPLKHLLMGLIFTKSMNQKRQNKNEEGFVIKFQDVQQCMPKIAGTIKRMAQQDKLNQLFDNNLVYLDEKNNIKLIMPIQYLRNLLRKYNDVWIKLIEVFRNPKYRQSIVKSNAGNMFQIFFWIQVLEGKDMQFSVKRNGNQEKMLIDDNIFGMKSFTGQKKGNGLIKRLKQMLKILKTINVQQKYFLVVPLLDQKLYSNANKSISAYDENQIENKTVLMSLVDRQNIIYERTSNSKAFDFMIIHISEDVIKIHTFDLTVLLQLREKVKKMNLFQKDYINNYLGNQKVQIGDNQKYRIEFYKYFVSPQQLNQVSYGFEIDENGDIKTKQKEENSPLPQKIKKIKSQKFQIPVIQAEKLISKNATQSQYAGIFNELSMHLKSKP